MLLRDCCDVSAARRMYTARLRALSAHASSPKRWRTHENVEPLPRYSSVIDLSSRALGTEIEPIDHVVCCYLLIDVGR